MPGNRCQYSKCLKTTMKYPGLSMFRFPKDKIISEVWALNSGNARLQTLGNEKLHSKYLCQEHFSPDDFMFAYDKRKKLKPKAVPFKYNFVSEDQPSTSYGFSTSDQTDHEDLILSTPIKTYDKCKTNTAVKSIFPSPNLIISTPQKEEISNLINMPSQSLKKKQSHDLDNEMPSKKKLKQNHLKKSKITHNSHISKLKKSFSNYKARNNFKSLMDTYKFPSCNSRALVSMQLKNKCRAWTTAERNLALTLFYKSPSTYTFLRLQKINLPALSTIRRWIGESKFLPGFNNDYFNHVKKKFEHKSYQEKACTISFDEINIKEFLEYSKQYDFIEGFQDLGTYGRINKSANYALVFLARGMYSPWKFPVSYYLSHSGVNKIVLKDLIVDVINKLFDIGLCPKVIVCDQSTLNQSVLKLLNITENDPFFFVNDQKIFSIFDVPHLLKSLCKNFIEAHFQKNNRTFSFKDINDAYNLDKLSIKSKALGKITDAHIHPTSFQKMHVKLAAQIFSHSMSAAIRTYAATGELGSKTAIDTADFIEFINNLFDCLNSSSLYSNNSYNSALTHSGTVKNFLLDASQYFINMKKIGKRKILKPKCFKGFTQTINAILQFFEEEKCNDIAFLMTNRLNQDALENLFSVFRQNNKNPTSRTIRTSIRRSSIFSLCASTRTNCEMQETNDFLSIDLDQSSTNTSNNEKIETFPDAQLISSSSLSNNELNLIDDPQIDTITLQDCSVNYFAGYLAYKCYKQFNCHQCQINLLTNKNYSSFQNDNGFKAPSISFCNIINRTLDIFEKHFEKMQHKKKLRFKLTLKIKNDDLINKWLNEFKSCMEHKLYIIDKLLICKIFKKLNCIQLHPN